MLKMHTIPHTLGREKTQVLVLQIFGQQHAIVDGLSLVKGAKLRQTTKYRICDHELEWGSGTQSTVQARKTTMGSQWERTMITRERHFLFIPVPRTQRHVKKRFPLNSRSDISPKTNEEKNPNEDLWKKRDRRKTSCYFATWHQIRTQ